MGRWRHACPAQIAPRGRWPPRGAGERAGRPAGPCPGRGAPAPGRPQRVPEAPGAPGARARERARGPGAEPAGRREAGAPGGGRGGGAPGSRCGRAAGSGGEPRAALPARSADLGRLPPPLPPAPCLGWSGRPLSLGSNSLKKAALEKPGAGPLPRAPHPRRPPARPLPAPRRAPAPLRRGPSPTRRRQPFGSRAAQRRAGGGAGPAGAGSPPGDDALVPRRQGSGCAAPPALAGDYLLRPAAAQLLGGPHVPGFLLLDR